VARRTRRKQSTTRDFEGFRRGPWHAGSVGRRGGLRAMRNWRSCSGVYSGMTRGPLLLLVSYSVWAQPVPRQEPMDTAIQAVWQARGMGQFAEASDKLAQARERLQRTSRQWCALGPTRSRAPARTGIRASACSRHSLENWHCASRDSPSGDLPDGVPPVLLSECIESVRRRAIGRVPPSRTADCAGISGSSGCRLAALLRSIRAIR